MTPFSILIVCSVVNTESKTSAEKISAATMEGDCLKAGCEGRLCFRHFRRSALRGYSSQRA